MVWFDESRLDDEDVLATADVRLRGLAESGSRVRREWAENESPVDEAVQRGLEAGRPRAVIAAGPDSRLLRAVLEVSCPVPFVAWPRPGLPGWAGSLDLVLVLAPDGADPGAASAVAEAARRGCQTVLAAPADSLVAVHAGRNVTSIPTRSTDRLAVAVVAMRVLERLSLGPQADADSVADALDDVAVACSPHRDLAVNPAKELAIALGDAVPVLWGGSVLAARAARRIAESLRSAVGRGAIAGDAGQVLPILEATPPRDVFDDPFEGGSAPRPLLIVLDDGAQDPVVVEERQRVTDAADGRGIRVDLLSSDAPTDLARYAALLLQGTYVAEYLRLGLTD